MSKDEFLILYPVCKVVKGARRGMICDLQNLSYHLVPNSLIDIIERMSTIPINQLYEEIDLGQKNILDDYINFIVSKRLGFITPNPESFPLLNSIFEYPSKVSNAIIAIDDHSKHDYNLIFSELSILNCKGLELRFLNSPSQKELFDILTISQNTRIQSIDLVIKSNSFLTTSFFMHLTSRFRRLNYIHVHSAAQDKEIEIEENYSFLRYTSKRVLDHSFCGWISEKNFSPNLTLFSESTQYNNCLNKKISIDEHGKIKNCPSMTKEYGEHGNVSLIEVIDNKDFHELWGITKDQVETCNVCEFRYICIDCRAYRNTKSITSKPSKCAYNPYLAQWENQN
ncbi:MAG: grasp-with-spasm system SPASM domain peptide maturase [Sphingobacterium sp.]|jgi:SPASM domain peptide maturase of grasp-with-spasm system|nr:grasp-with-spasm system SPASM domain peptide maturase [Sphingobacterium sp.]